MRKGSTEGPCFPLPVPSEPLGHTVDAPFRSVTCYLLSAGHCSLRSALGDPAQGGHLCIIVLEAVAFAMLEGGCGEEPSCLSVPCLAQERAVFPSNDDCLLSCPCATVLPLPHHRVPAAAGCGHPGLRLLRQGNAGSLEASSVPEGGRGSSYS